MIPFDDWSDRTGIRFIEGLSLGVSEQADWGVNCIETMWHDMSG